MISTITEQVVYYRAVFDSSTCTRSDVQPLSDMHAAPAPPKNPPMTFSIQTQTDPEITDEPSIGSNATVRPINKKPQVVVVEFRNSEIILKKVEPNLNSTKTPTHVQSRIKMVNSPHPTKSNTSDEQQHALSLLSLSSTPIVHKQSSKDKRVLSENLLKNSNSKTPTTLSNAKQSIKRRRSNKSPSNVNGVSDDNSDVEPPRKQSKTEPKDYSNVIIGDNGSVVPQHVLDQIKWKSPSDATRKLLLALFSRKVLATHSLTGKPSPAFIGRPIKPQLDPLIIADIINFVTERVNVPKSTVRSSITTMCADENKMLRQRQKQLSLEMESMEQLENADPLGITMGDRFDDIDMSFVEISTE